jgi:serine/threonine protein kinase
MLQGRVPWPASSGSIYDSISLGRYVITRKVPVALRDLIKRMLTIDPNERWPAKALFEHQFFVSGMAVGGVHSVATLPTLSLLGFQVGHGVSVSRSVVARRRSAARIPALQSFKLEIDGNVDRHGDSD